MWTTSGRASRIQDISRGIALGSLSPPRARTETPRGYRVEASTAGGTTTTYEVENLPTGDLRRFRIEPGMGRTEILLRTDGSTRYAYPDGTIAELVEGPDPRFGMQVPVINSLIVTSPGGSVSTTTG